MQTSNQTSNLLPVGSYVRSFDFPTRDAELNAERGECYCEGFIRRHVAEGTIPSDFPCDRYEIKVTRRVWAGEEVRVNVTEETIFPAMFVKGGVVSAALPNALAMSFEKDKVIAAVCGVGLQTGKVADQPVADAQARAFHLRNLATWLDSTAAAAERHAERQLDELFADAFTNPDDFDSETDETFSSDDPFLDGMTAKQLRIRRELDEVGEPID